MANPFEYMRERFDRLESMILDIAARPQPEHREEPAYMSVTEAARFINLSVQSVYNLTHKGEIPCIRRRKNLLFRRDELTVWLEQGRKIELTVTHN